MSDDEKCPKCGGELERDEADVGVGIVYGPAGCPACFWVEDPLRVVRDVNEDPPETLPPNTKVQ